MKMTDSSSLPRKLTQVPVNQTLKIFRALANMETPNNISPENLKIVLSTLDQFLRSEYACEKIDSVKWLSVVDLCRKMARILQSSEDSQMMIDLAEFSVTQFAERFDEECLKTTYRPDSEAEKSGQGRKVKKML